MENRLGFYNCILIKCTQRANNLTRQKHQLIDRLTDRFVHGSHVKEYLMTLQSLSS